MLHLRLPARTAALTGAAAVLLVPILAGPDAVAAPSAIRSAPTPTAPSASTASQHPKAIRLHRGGKDATVRFSTRAPGEEFLDLSVSARRVSWSDRGNESSVVSAFVDGHYVTDIVITSASPTRREFALGSLEAGRHILRLHYAADRSPSNAGRAALSRLRFRSVGASDPEYVADKYAPIVYGRSLAQFGGVFQNAFTDTPLIAWHEIQPAVTPSHSVIEYSVVWSNEDGGTDTPALMARWGRSTDIEWIYRVEVDADGNRVPGTGVYQAANHQTLPFAGQYDAGHPLLETCTSNNNMCDVVDDPMRFSLSTVDTRPVEAPREFLMDTHPWTYPVMAKEMVREGKIESPSDPSTQQVGDQRTYLYVAVDHDTTPPEAAGGVGLIVGVTLKGDPTTYLSNHDVPSWSMNRDVPAATTVELPIGTTASDVESVSVTRVPIDADNGATLTVTDIDRAFFLGSDYLPGASFVQWHGSQTLTAASPTATLWTAG